jgi:hypothetical protein
MGKRGTQAFAASAAIALLMLSGAVPALAATTASRHDIARASAAGVEYKGKTSQGLSFEVTKNGSSVTVSVGQKATCKPTKDIKSVHVTVFGKGHVKGSTFKATGAETYPAGGGYMGAFSLTISGKISSTSTSGTFTVDNGVYNVISGNKVAECDTGKQTFKGKKA